MLIRYPAGNHLQKNCKNQPLALIRHSALFGFNSKRIPKLLKVLKPTILRAKRMDNQQSSFRVKSLCNQNRRGRAVEELIAQ